MRKTSIAIALLPFMLMIGCKARKVNPSYSNLRKGTFSYDMLTSKDKVLDVRVGPVVTAAAPKEEEKPRTLWDLRDSLPHVLVKTLATKVNSADEIYTIMSKPVVSLEKEKDQPAQTDYTLYKVKLYFSPLKRYFTDQRFMHENTRINYLNTYVKKSDNDNVKFYSIDRLENEFDEVDLGTLERNKAVSINAKLSLTGNLGTNVENTSSNTTGNNSNSKNGNEQNLYDASGNLVAKVNNTGEIVRTNGSSNATNVKSGASLGAAGEIGYLNTESIKEALAIKLRTMRTGFAFSQDEIVISQAGRPNGEVSMNTYATITLKFGGTLTSIKNVYTFKNLFNDNNVPSKASELTFSRRQIEYVKCGNMTPINLPIAFEGAIRAVENDAKQTGESSLEYDDKVHNYYLPMQTGTPVSIDPFKYCKEVYKIVVKDKNGKNYNLQISWRTTEELDLFSEENPEQFMQWLSLMLEKPSIANLTTVKFKLYFEGPGNSTIDVAKADMKEADIKLLKNLDLSTLNRMARND